MRPARRSAGHGQARADAGAAARDRGPGFAADLITSRGQPGFLAALFDDRRTRAYAPSALAADAPSATALAGKAAAAMLRWGKAGFSTVDSETLERRESACLGCPNLADPASAVQKMVLVGAVTDKVGSRLGGKVCNLCGCVVHKKIRSPTEACPTRTRSSPA